jgi:hypothetical protein
MTFLFDWYNFRPSRYDSYYERQKHRNHSMLVFYQPRNIFDDDSVFMTNPHIYTITDLTRCADVLYEQARRCVKSKQQLLDDLLARKAEPFELCHKVGKDEIVFWIDLPGLDPKDLVVQLEDTNLVVAGIPDIDSPTGFMSYSYDIRKWANKIIVEKMTSVVKFGRLTVTCPFKTFTSIKIPLAIEAEDRERSCALAKRDAEHLIEDRMGASQRSDAGDPILDRMGASQEAVAFADDKVSTKNDEQSTSVTSGQVHALYDKDIASSHDILLQVCETETKSELFNNQPLSVPEPLVVLPMTTRTNNDKSLSGDTDEEEDEDYLLLSTPSTTHATKILRIVDHQTSTSTSATSELDDGFVFVEEKE